MNRFVYLYSSNKPYLHVFTTFSVLTFLADHDPKRKKQHQQQEKEDDEKEGEDAEGYEEVI